ncbi:hypothetical protein GF373_17565 [bacterium]|nr:hypothetical protein [bacterium]
MTVEIQKGSPTQTDWAVLFENTEDLKTGNVATEVYHTLKNMGHIAVVWKKGHLADGQVSIMRISPYGERSPHYMYSTEDDWKQGDLGDINHALQRQLS